MEDRHMEEDIRLNFANDTADTAAKRALDVFNASGNPKKVKVQFTVTEGSHKIEATAKLEKEGDDEVKLTVESKLVSETTDKPN